MGQKIHPHGLRVGVNRKWNSTWFVEDSHYNVFFYAQFMITQFLKAFLHLYPYVKTSATKKVALVDVKWIRAGISQLYLFIFFYKFRTRKRRWEFNKTLKKNKNKKIQSTFNKNFIQCKTNLKKNVIVSNIKVTNSISRRNLPVRNERVLRTKENISNITKKNVSI